MDFLTSLFNIPTYRWFAEVDKEEELPTLYENPFLQPTDVIYCKENNSYYAYVERILYDEDYNPTGEMEKGFELLSKEDQHRETINFFHKLNIGDTFTLKDKEEKEHSCKVINITYSLLLKDASYTFVMDDNKEIPYTQLVSQIDAKLVEGKPMQLLIFDKDIKNG